MGRFASKVSQSSVVQKVSPIKANVLVSWVIFTHCPLLAMKLLEAGYLLGNVRWSLKTITCNTSILADSYWICITAVDLVRSFLFLGYARFHQDGNPYEIRRIAESIIYRTHIPNEYFNELFETHLVSM